MKRPPPQADAYTGKEIASAIYFYPRWRDGLYCNASLSQFRQHPQDYIDGLEQSIRYCLRKAGEQTARNIKAISIDTTGSTPVAIDSSGLPLALLPKFANNPNAMFLLWKDHTGLKEAEEINEHAKKFNINYLQFVGGVYSSEWFWAKLLHILREDQELHKACYSFAEHCDWIPFLLTGGSKADDMKRGVCSAGHKALWAREFGGLPPDKFFSSLDPLLKGFTSRLFTEVYTADKPVGHLSAEWAQRLGLSTEVIIGIGAFDAHMGAVGGQIEPYHLSKVMGTSTCDMLVAPMEEMNDKLVKGICGQVPGSVIPGMMGMEAGQSAFGDFYAWFRDTLAWPIKNILNASSLVDPAMAKALADETIEKIIPELSRRAAALPLNVDDELAIDWINGRRTPDANQSLTSALTGLNLGTDAVRLFKSVAESTCFGAKAIVDSFRKEGIPVKGLIGLGGIAGKSPFIMQMMADIMDMPIRIHRSEQTCALGAAMFAATAAGIYNKVENAMEAMGQGFSTTYLPTPAYSAIFAERFKRYADLGVFMEQQAIHSKKHHSVY
ncbi:MAG: ribulokinase [Flavitalea sp.]